MMSANHLILDSASTSEAPGQVGFFKQVISTYFTRLSSADKRSCFAAAMRYAGTYEFGNLQGQEFVSAKNKVPIFRKNLPATAIPNIWQDCMATTPLPPPDS